MKCPYFRMGNEELGMRGVFYPIFIFVSKELMNFSSCEMAMIVVSVSDLRYEITRSTDCASRAEVGSSRSRIGLRRRAVVTKRIRCFCPPEISVIALSSKACSRPSLSNSANIVWSVGIEWRLARNWNGERIISRIVLYGSEMSCGSHDVSERM